MPRAYATINLDQLSATYPVHIHTRFPFKGEIMDCTSHSDVPTARRNCQHYMATGRTEVEVRYDGAVLTPAEFLAVTAP